MDAEVSKNILEPSERIEVNSLTIACDGGGGALGHPRVFLTLKDGSANLSCFPCGGAARGSVVVRHLLNPV